MTIILCYGLYTIFNLSSVSKLRNHHKHYIQVQESMKRSNQSLNPTDLTKPHLLLQTVQTKLPHQPYNEVLCYLTNNLITYNPYNNNH